MLSRRVDSIAAAQQVQNGQNVGGLPAGDVVQVEGDHVPAQDMSGLAPSFPQLAADKAAHVLQIVLLPLGHLQVGSQRLGAADRRLQTLHKLGPEEPLRRPFCGVAGSGGTDRYFSVVIHKGITFL